MTGAEAQAKEQEFVIYSTGVCYMSVCTSLSPEEATARVNAEAPTGVASKWELSEATFRTGQPNPCPCDKKPKTHKHFLFSC